MRSSGAVRKYACATCPRSFVKAEHLARHVLVHTGMKPFSCDACGQRFSRQDSLTRHFQRSGHQGDKAAAPRDPSQSQLQRETPAWAGDDLRTMGQIEGDPGFGLGVVPPSTDTMVGLEDDPFMQLTWPDSEALLQCILGNSIDPVPANMSHLSHTTPPVIGSIPYPKISSPWLPQDSDGSSNGGSEAVRNMSQIIVDVSSHVTSDAESTSLTTVFLDECLHLFFERFIPKFPVSHRATFAYGEWTHPMLLNAIAIGSLFLCEEKHVSQGEALWKLAHVAVATSWHTLIQHQASNDLRKGVQLVGTALLGQTYAMLSRNTKLRTTAQMFHSLGFYWACECGLYSTSRAFDRSSIEGVTKEILSDEWRRWVAEEVQLRILLGHYILDSQLAQFISASTSQRHTSSSLPLPSSDRLFQASTAEQWAEALSMEPSTELTFRELFLNLHSHEERPSSIPPELPPLAFQVVLEGMRSVILESKRANGPILGAPSPEASSVVLGKLNTYLKASHNFSKGHQTELMINWHSVCIDAVGDPVVICQDLCSLSDIQQEIFGQRKNVATDFQAKAWVATSAARKALLHASAVYDLLDDLPFSHAHAIHVPMATFAAAMIYCAFIFGDVTTAAIPTNIDWALLMNLNNSGVRESDGLRSRTGLQKSLTADFIFGRSTFGSGRTRNLLYELNGFLLRLRQIAQPWGISIPLESVLRQLMSCRRADLNRGSQTG